MRKHRSEELYKVFESLHCIFNLSLEIKNLLQKLPLFYWPRRILNTVINQLMVRLLQNTKITV